MLVQPALNLRIFCRHDSSSGQLSDVEFDEILQRNKTVSSSAISRAVQDASAGLKARSGSFILSYIVYSLNS